MKIEQHYEPDDWITVTQARTVAHMNAKKFRDVLGHLIHPIIGGRPHTGLVNYGELIKALDQLPHYELKD